MNITIVGGGNIGTQFAVHCAEKGHKVKVCTSAPELFDKHLEIVNEADEITHEGDIEYATNEPHSAFSDADVIMVTVPSNCMKETAQVIYENSSPNAWIGVVPGNGGSECAFRKCIERGNIFFGIERVPAIARLVQKGKRVRSVGYKPELHVSTLPIAHVEKCTDFIGSLFDIPCSSVPNMLALTMTPSNPILHTTRLMTIFKDYKKGVVYDRLPLFYEEWDDESSELLFKCDDEVQKICRSLTMFDLSFVRSLKIHYESDTPQKFSAKLRSIKAFKGLTTPSVKVEGGMIPDLNSRYFTADFSYGLSLIVQIADFAGVEVPYLKSVMKWYDTIRIVQDEFSYKDYGISDLKSFLDYYSL